MDAAEFDRRIEDAAQAILGGSERASLEHGLESAGGDDALRVGVMRLCGARSDDCFGCAFRDVPWGGVVAEFADWPDGSLPRLAEALCEEDRKLSAAFGSDNLLGRRHLYDLFWRGPVDQVWHTAFRADSVDQAKAFIRSLADTLTIRLVPFRDGSAVLVDAGGAEHLIVPELEPAQADTVWSA